MGRSCRGSTPPARRPASAVAACTAIVRWKALFWAAACFLAATPGAQQRRRPPEGPGWHFATAWGPICLCRIEPLSCNVFSNRARPFMRPAHAPQAGPIRGSEAELVQRARNRDEAAIHSIMQSNNRRLYRLSPGGVWNDREAAGVAQATYVRALTD